MFRDWNSADWVSNIMGILLFFVGWCLGRKQENIIEHVAAVNDKQTTVTEQINALTAEVHSLQRAIAELQIREKIGVIKERAFQVEGKDQKAVFTLVEDSCSVLPLYEWASPSLQADYERSLDHAFHALAKTADTNAVQLESLARRLVVFSNTLSDKNPYLARNIKSTVTRGICSTLELGHAEHGKMICSLIAPSHVIREIFANDDQRDVAAKLQLLLL